MTRALFGTTLSGAISDIISASNDLMKKSLLRHNRKNYQDVH